MSGFKKYGLMSLMPVLLSAAVSAAPAPAKNTVGYHLPSWRGFYFGALTGGVAAKFKNKYFADPGAHFSTGQSDLINVNGDQSLRNGGFIAGLTGGYNWQSGIFLAGLEADFVSQSINDSNYSGAVVDPLDPTNLYVLTTYDSANWLVTLRPRMGVVTNAGLLYLTGGLAASFLQTDFLFTDTNGSFISKRVRWFKPGYILGAGFETGLTRNVSMKLEYMFSDFGKTVARDMNLTVTPGQPFRNTVKYRENMLRLGVNYYLNGTDELSPQLLPELLDLSQWHVELGVRPFFSTGVDGAPQPLLNTGSSRLASRLIFSELDAASLDVYGRVDHVDGFFAKGTLGAGTVLRGKLNDEDFPAGGAYSNTLSDALGNLAYGNIDFGYSFIREPGSKAGAFFGYSYYDENLDVYDCTQLAGAGVCVPSTTLHNFLGISQSDTYKSLRIGVTSEFNISDKLKLIAEAAYLPMMRFNGVDYHNARQLILPQSSGRGDGSMLESILSYRIADNWDVGVGARYWMWNMRDGSNLFNFLATPDINGTEPARFNARRYGGFLQLSFHDKPSHKYEAVASAVDWSGWYVGGNLGGAWGENSWPDPYGPTPGDPGFTNAAGFGGDIYATGPTGQLDAAYYWQTRDNIVLGLQGTGGIQNMRGDDTLFSGIGGLNGQVNSRYLLTFVGKVGVTYDRSLFYVDAGPAFLTTKYIINGNTTAQTLGREYKTAADWGFTVGGGIEYAFNKKWTTTVGYDFVHVRQIQLSFPNIITIGSQDYRVNQNMNVFKVGFNYKLT